MVAATRRPFLIHGACLTALLLVLTAGPAYAHINSWTSVDDGEIRYEDYTQWNDSLTWAKDRWNEVGVIDVLPDSAGTITDLEIRDYSSSSDQLCGSAAQRGGADLISLNNYNYANYSTGQRRACTTHEFGHTLKLDHSYTTQVMDPCPVCSPSVYTTPQAHDKSDYHSVWG